jgi:FKBP-type peptidyl-prolyl cis-trans isomerase FkpA
MKFIFCILAVFLFTHSLIAATAKTEEQKLLYSLGLIMGRNLMNFKLDNKEIEFVLQVVKDMIMEKKTHVDISVYGPKVKQWASNRDKKNQKLNAKLSVQEKKKGKELIFDVELLNIE